ncbi:hypothetical protein F5Y13DRAFT_98278 [Hypoxylon sp. FL1857]|nr:hypothetical protein F5Y13DRAFT_98278 [Hypoxylon sp. FL1857]
MLTKTNPYNSAYRVTLPPHVQLRNSSRPRTYEKSSDQSDDDYFMHPRRVRSRRGTRSVTRSSTRRHGRIKRRMSEREEPVDYSDWESTPYPWRVRPRLKAIPKGSTASASPEPAQSTPATAGAEAIPDPRSVETSSLLNGLDSGKVGKTAKTWEYKQVSATTRLQPSTSKSMVPSSPSPKLTVPALNSPIAGIPHAEYEVFDSESACWPII